MEGSDKKISIDFIDPKEVDESVFSRIASTSSMIANFSQMGDMSEIMSQFQELRDRVEKLEKRSEIAEEPKPVSVYYSSPVLACEGNSCEQVGDELVCQVEILKPELSDYIYLSPPQDFHPTSVTCESGIFTLTFNLETWNAEQKIKCDFLGDEDTYEPTVVPFRLL